jgi:hypothetical protein
MGLPDSEDRLDSWKEIAAYLGRTARTVQRWEKTAGLPVHRGGPGTRSGVMASKKEVGEWWRLQRHKLLDEDSGDGTAEDEAAAVTTTGPRRPRTGRVVVLVGLVVVAGAAAGILVGNRIDSAGAVVSRIGRVLPLSTSEGRQPRHIAVTSAPSGLAVSGDGRALFVSLPVEKAIAVIDVESGLIRERLPGVDGSGMIDIAPDGRMLAVGGATEVGLIDVVRRTIRRVAVGHFVRDVRVSAGGRRVWVTLAQGGLRMIETASLRLTTIPTIGCPMFLAYGARTERMFVSYQCHGPGGRQGHDAIEVFDEPTGRSLMTRSGPPLVGSPMALSADEQHLWAGTHDACESNEYDQEGCPAGQGPVFIAFRTGDMEPLAVTRYPVANGGPSLTFFPDSSRLLVSSGGIYVVNAGLGHIEEGFELEASGSVEMAPTNDRVFVAAPKDNRIVELLLGPVDDARSVDGLVTYWTGDGGASDLVGGMHAVSVDRTAFAPGRLGRAFAFDGKSAGVSFGRRIDIDLTDGPATYAAWIRPTLDGSTGTLMSRASFKGWRLGLRGGRLEFCFARAPRPIVCGEGGLIATGAAPMAAHAWHHVAVVRSPGELGLFVNGTPVASTSLAGYVPPPGADYDEEPITRLGAGRPGSRPFDGLIDEVTMFRRALDSAALARLMQLTTAPSRGPDRRN